MMDLIKESFEEIDEIIKNMEMSIGGEVEYRGAKHPVEMSLTHKSGDEWSVNYKFSIGLSDINGSIEKELTVGYNEGKEIIEQHKRKYKLE